MIGKDKLKVLLKEAQTIRGNLESYIKTKNKLIHKKLLSVRDSMLNFIENVKMENSFCSGVCRTETSAIEKKSLFSIKKRMPAIKDSPNLNTSFANIMKRSSESGYIPQFNTINTNLPISLVCLSTVISPKTSNQKKTYNFSHYINNTQLSTLGAYSTFQSTDTKIGKKSKLVNSLKLMSMGEIKRKINLLNKKEVKWEILSKNSEQLKDYNYPHILPKQMINKQKNDKLILKENLGPQEISFDNKKHQLNISKQLKRKPYQKQKAQNSFKDQIIGLKI